MIGHMSATPCTAIEVIPTADGPYVAACLCEVCRGREQVKARIARTGDVFLGAATADDSEW